jgi:hypothetical protein
VLVAGDLGCDITRNSLTSVLAAWVADRPYDAGGDDALDATAITDDDADLLTGSSGADLFFIDFGDKITDFKFTNKDGDQVEYV